MSKIEKKIVEKIGGGMGFAEFLAWASEQDIDNADVIATKLAAKGELRIDYLSGMFLPKLPSN